MGIEAVLPFIIVFGSITIGIFLLVLLIAILKSYVKAPANRAFVRTGGFRKAGGPPLVVMNGGAWVFKAIHEITWVDLGTMAVEIERTEENALLTRDPQYADIRAIFYIKVDATTEGISKGARTIGGKEVNAEAVKQLVDAKLDGALRDVAATFTLMGLHGERESFIEEVQTRLKGDLDENGLALESVSILTLKSARQGTFPTDDVFGAQVARANAEVIQTAMRERNDIERQTEVGGLTSWSDLSDRVRIHGSTPARGGSNVGYVRLSTVQFGNTVRVEMGRVSDGSASFTYRETFYWDNVVDALVETFVQSIDRNLARRYPDLSGRERGELTGFVRAQLWGALDDGLLEADGDGEEELRDGVVNRTTEHAVKIVRVSYPGAEEAPIRRMLTDLFEDDSHVVQTFLDETIPGLTLSINTSIQFRLNMPGRVTDSNAHETDGNTLIWEFSPSDAIQTPIEIFAESKRAPL